MRVRQVLWLVAVLLLAGSASAGKAEAGSGAQGARWQDATVPMILDPTTADLGFDILETVISAVSAWQITGDTLPTVTVERGPEFPLGYKTGEHNANTVSFAKDGTKRAKGALAITIITFDLDRGVILDADIVLNGEHPFATMNVDGTGESNTKAYDVQNVLTHEFGHFLGLGEDYEHKSATMYAYSLPGETSKRDLAQPDTIAITDLYKDPPQDDPYTTQAAGCGAASIAQGPSLPYEWLSVSLLSLATMLWMRRRQRQKLTAVAATLMTLSMVLGLNSTPKAPPSDLVSVVDVQSHWEEGLIVTQASLEPAACTGCKPTSVELLGGQIGSISQVVNGLKPLQTGQKLKLSELELHRRHGL